MTARTPVAIDLRRPKSVGEVLGDALRCYARYPVLFAALALGVVVPYTLILLAVNGSAPLGEQHGGATAVLILLLLDVLIVTPLISALHIHALVAVGEGRQPRLLEVAWLGVRVLPVVAAAEVVAGIATGVGFLLLVVPGVYLLIRLAVVAQAAAIERGDWLSALRRSGELTAGNYLHVFGVLVIVGLVALGLEQSGAAIVGTAASVLQVLVVIVLLTITRSFVALTTAVLYFDLLARRAS
jgi:hypothetical protein